MNLQRFGLVLTAFALGTGGFLLGQELWTGAHSANSAAPRADSKFALGGSPASRLIFASGVVEGTQRDVALRFELQGRIDTIHVREGDVVKKGDLLAELAAQTWEQRVAEAAARLKLTQAERERLVNAARAETREVLKAEVQAAEVSVQETETLISRARQLAAKNAISPQDLDDNRFKHAKANAALHAARAKLAEVEAAAREDDLRIADARIELAQATWRHERALLDQTRLRAPVDGIVLHILVEPGELVGPADDRALITITNRDRTRVRAYVEELDALAVSPGQSAYVTIDGKPDKRYDGTILDCSLLVRGKSQRHHKPGELVDVKVREVVVELQEADDLVIGLPVDVYIRPAESR